MLCSLLHYGTTGYAPHLLLKTWNCFFVNSRTTGMKLDAKGSCKI